MWRKKKYTAPFPCSVTSSYLYSLRWSIKLTQLTYRLGFLGTCTDRKLDFWKEGDSFLRCTGELKNGKMRTPIGKDGLRLGECQPPSRKVLGLR